MVLLLFLAFFVFSTQAQDPRQCSYDQGPIALCRDLDANGTNVHKWNVRLPINAKRIFIGRLHDSEVIDTVLLQEQDLDRRRVQIKPGGDILNSCDCKIDDQEADFVRLIDISDRDIRDGAWYVLCGEYDVADNTRSQKNQASKRGYFGVGGNWIPDHPSGFGRRDSPIEDQRCMHCALLRAVGPDRSSKLIKYDWINDPQARLDRVGILRYLAGDLPSSVKISGRLIDLDEKEEAFQFERLIKPRQQVFIQVPIRGDRNRYMLIADLIPQNKNGTDLLVNDRPLVLVDYLRNQDQQVYYNDRKPTPPAALNQIGSSNRNINDIPGYLFVPGFG